MACATHQVQRFSNKDVKLKYAFGLFWINNTFDTQSSEHYSLSKQYHTFLFVYDRKTSCIPVSPGFSPFLRRISVFRSSSKNLLVGDFLARSRQQSCSLHCPKSNCIQSIDLRHAKSILRKMSANFVCIINRRVPTVHAEQI